MLRLTRELASHRLRAVNYLNNLSEQRGYCAITPLAGADKIQYVSEGRLEAKMDDKKKRIREALLTIVNQK
jgi:hypothetical protein